MIVDKLLPRLRQTKKMSIQISLLLIFSHIAVHHVQIKRNCTLRLGILIEQLCDNLDKIIVVKFDWLDGSIGG